MQDTMTLSSGQTEAAVFPSAPDPPIASIGSLADQFRAIDCYLSLPNSIRERDPAFCWTVVAGVIEHQKGGQR